MQDLTISPDTRVRLRRGEHHLFFTGVVVPSPANTPDGWVMILPDGDVRPGLYERDRVLGQVPFDWEGTADSERYTNRSVRWYEVAKLTRHETGKGTTVETTDGHGFARSADALPRSLQVGDWFGLETRGFSRITGILYAGTWYGRQTDADIEHERQAFIAATQARHETELAAKRGEWAAREAALPEWIRVRLATFHEHGGHDFDRDAWGYELIIAELAALYDEASPDLDDTAEITAYAEREGTSGNQHGFARALAAHHRAGESAAETAAAMPGAARFYGAS